jgi:redox-sensitive bicupin YhaK (pirin superfamily)
MTDAVIKVEKLGFPWQPADPFLFCVHHDDAYPAGNDRLGPATALAGRNIGQDFEGKDGWRMYHGRAVPGFPQHPHRGFETVTIVRRGLIDHSDSLGATARFGRGDVQWLTAGRGIVHCEMFPLVESAKANPLELFQIWLNLPRADKMVEPHFAMLWGDEIPRCEFTDGAERKTEVTIVAGALDGKRAPSPPPHSWASRAESDVAIWCVRMEKGATWTMPPAASAKTSRTLFFFAGPKLRVGDREIDAKRAITLRGDRDVAIEAGDDTCEMLLLQGVPIAEPVAQYGPFVMNTREEIERAISDYQRTRFGGWPWPSNEPVHAREQSRFAKHADGTIEQRGR